MTLTGPKNRGGGTEVSVAVQPASKVYDHESSLIHVTPSKGGLTGEKVPPRRAHVLVHLGVIHRLHECGEA